MKKALLIAYCVLYLAACAIPALGLVPGMSSESRENRVLSAMPALWDESGLNEDFGKQFDIYFSEHFALRSQMVTLNALLRAAVLKQSANDDVILGKDGWLFFAPTLNDYMGLQRLPDGDIARLARTLALFEEAAEEKGCRFVVALVPNKNTLYPQYMPSRLPATAEDSNLDRLQAALSRAGVGYADIQAALLARPEILYHRTDTHWTNRGAFVGREAILTALEPDRTPTPEPPCTARPVWSGDLAVMLYPALDLREDQYIYDWEPGYEYVGTPPRAMDELRIETRGGASSHRLLMFRDSFANALIPLIAGEYEAALFSRAVPYDLSLADEVNADTVVLQIVERNIPKMLEQAPLTDAPARETVPEISLTVDGALTCKVQDDGRLLVTGWLDADPAAAILVQLTPADGEPRCYEAYPILAEERQQALGMPEGAAGFTARVAGLPAGEYTVRVMGERNGEWVAAEATYTVG